MAAGEQRWCVVTGGRGFAARHLVNMLISSETVSVRVADLGPAIDLEPSEETGILGEALRDGRAEYVSIDLRNKAEVLKGPPRVRTLKSQRILISELVFICGFSLVQHSKGLRLCFTWRLRIPPLTITSCIVRLTLMVGNVVLTENFFYCAYLGAFVKYQ